MLSPAGGSTRPKRWTQLAVLFIASIFVLWSLFFTFRTSFIATDGHRYFSLFDDAMISMRYAWNASHGLGLVWNPGERVEGYTNLLMVALMYLWTSLFDKSSAVLAVQVSGIPMLLGIAGLSMLHWNELAKGNEVEHRNGLAVIAFLAPLAYYPLVYWTLMGMETGLLTVLLLAGSLLSMTYMRTKNSSALTSAALAFSLAYLARPDSAPVAVMVLLFAAAFSAGGDRRRLSAALRALAVFMIFPILQTLFRVFYYGSWVPLTYTLKATGMPMAARLQNGLGFTLPFLGEARWAFLVAGAGAALGISRRKALLMLPPLILTAYQIAIGGDAWPYWRLVAPGIPYLTLLTLTGVDWASARLGPIALGYATRIRAVVTKRYLSTRSGTLRLPPLALLVGLAGAGLVLAGVFADYIRPGSPGFGLSQLYLVVGGSLLSLTAIAARRVPGAHLAAFCTTVLLLLSLNGPFLREAFFLDLPYKADANRSHVNVALSINQFTTEGASVGVIQAGIIPYYTSRYAVDFLGKNDPYIAGLPADLSGSVGWSGMTSVPGHNKYDLEYSIHQRLPTYVEDFSWGAQDLSYVFRELYVEISLPGPDPAFRLGDPAVRWDEIPAEKILFP
jgi:hypothetical protein